MKLSRNLGMPFLGIYLIATGLCPLLGIHVPGGGAILALLALVADVSVLLGR